MEFVGEEQELGSSLESSSSASHVAQLRESYRNELHAPELLPHRSQLVDRVRALANQQADRIAALPETESLERCLYEIELERVHFQLRAYLRARLTKISKFAIYLNHSESTRDLLSEHEKTFLDGYIKLYQDHIDREAWGCIPEAQKLPAQMRDINLGGSNRPDNSLLVRPNLRSHVFVQALRDCDPITPEDSGHHLIELFQDDIVMLPYGDIRELVINGSVCLL